MYIYCRFEEVSAIKWSKLVTFSITGSQIFFANFVIFARNEQKTGYRFTIPTTRYMDMLRLRNCSLLRLIVIKAELEFTSTVCELH